MNFVLYINLFHRQFRNVFMDYEAKIFILIIGCSAIVLLISYFDDVIHDEDYLLQNYDAPILATIPDLLAKTPKRYGYYGSSAQAGSKGGKA